MKTLLSAALALGIAGATPAYAAGGAGYVDDIGFSFEGPFGTFDRHQLQRGFQVFNEVCAGCHGLRYLSFRDLGRADGPAFPEEQIRAIAENYEVFDPELEPGETRPALPSDRFPANEALNAPDLTLMAKARAGFTGPSGLLFNQLTKGIGGPEYIYSLLTNYNGEEQEVAGNILYGNDTMSGGWISMAPPLYEGAVEYAAYGVEEGDHSLVVPEATEKQMAEDVSAFLMWAAEPTMVERKQAGFRNLVMLVILAVLLYYTNKRLWAPIKRKQA